MSAGAGGHELLAKGVLVVARLEFTVDRLGRQLRDLAESAFASIAGAAHGMILATRWYPMAYLTTLEQLITTHSRARAASPLWLELGAFEAGRLLTGTHAPLLRTSPGEMAAQLPRLYGLIYQGVELRLDSLDAERCSFGLGGYEPTAEGVAAHAGFVRHALLLAGAGVPETAARPDPGHAGWTLSCRWQGARSARFAETVQVNSESRILDCRAVTRKACKAMGFDQLDSVSMMTCVSELARNIVNYAGEGQVSVREELRDGQRAVVVIAEDRGPGISDLDDVMGGSYRSTSGLGRGLLAVKRLCDDFNISTSSAGTRVEAVKLLRVK